MPDTIEPLDSTAAGVLLMNAMVASCDDMEFSKRYIEPCLKQDGEPVTVQVVLTVNGHEVPFMQTVSAAWRQIAETMDAAIREEALALVSKARLDPLMHALDDAEWKLSEALRKVQESGEHHDGIWRDVPMPLDYTCGCGLFVHPSRRNPDAVHISDCPYANGGQP